MATQRVLDFQAFYNSKPSLLRRTSQNLCLPSRLFSLPVHPFCCGESEVSTRQIQESIKLSPPPHPVPTPFLSMLSSNEVQLPHQDLSGSSSPSHLLQFIQPHLAEPFSLSLCSGPLPQSSPALVQVPPVRSPQSKHNLMSEAVSFPAVLPTVNSAP